jgi:hypothetical protein
VHSRVHDVKSCLGVGSRVTDLPPTFGLLPLLGTWRDRPIAYFAAGFFLLTLSARANRWLAGGAALVALAAILRALGGYPVLTLLLCFAAGAAAGFVVPRQRLPIAGAALVLGAVLAAYAVFGPADGLL